MTRGFEQGSRLRSLDKQTEIHDTDAISHVAHHRQVMADERAGQAELGLKILHQIQNLRLDQDIEGGCRLIGDKQFRPEGEHQRDNRPLTMPPENSWG